MSEIQLIDYAENLVVLDRNTVENLYKLDNCDECITLYLLYYKLAKWQKTDTVKANDEYVRKCLKWGRNKIIRAKQTLKDNGLIEIVQKRKNSKIDGWYIKIHYIVSKQKTTAVNVKQEVSFQDVSNSTCTEQETIALRNNINCLKNKIELLKEENNKLKSLLKEETKQNDFNNNLFDKFWNAYPRHVSKGTAEKWFEKNKPSEELVNIMIDKISLLKNSEQWKSENGKYIPYPTTWLNAKGWEDEVISTNTEEKSTLKEISEGLFQL